MDSQLYGTRLFIDCKAIAKNIKYFKKFFPNVEVMAVVKANAYGHGDIRFCEELKKNDISLFAVADFEEGLRLRKVFHKTRIMVMNPGINNVNTIIQNNLEPVIYSDRVLNEIVSSTKNYHDTINVHIKVNTGMNRWGINVNDIYEVLEILKKNNTIKIRSIYTHLSSSNKPDSDPFSKTQLRQFYKLENYNNLTKHVFSSHGSIRLLKKSDKKQIIRLGLATYGGLKHPSLEPVSELKCSINQIRTIKRGESVGYNQSFIATKETRVGVIAFGYADGVQRHWGNGQLKFYFKGNLIPTIGSISMDSCTVDLSGSNDVGEGDELVYFGKDRPIWDLARELNTIPYEIMSTLSRRIKRIYIN